VRYFLLYYAAGIKLRDLLHIEGDAAKINKAPIFTTYRQIPGNLNHADIFVEVITGHSLKPMLTYPIGLVTDRYQQIIISVTIVTKGP